MFIFSDLNEMAICGKLYKPELYFVGPTSIELYKCLLNMVKQVFNKQYRWLYTSQWVNQQRQQQRWRWWSYGVFSLFCKLSTHSYKAYITCNNLSVSDSGCYYSSLYCFALNKYYDRGTNIGWIMTIVTHTSFKNIMVVDCIIKQGKAQ